MLKKLLKVDNFILKIIACLTMTLDHIGVFLEMYLPATKVGLAVTILRTLGRLSFPIFAFLIVEGALHTKNIKMYILRIGIMTAIIGIALIVLQYSNIIPLLSTSITNIFLLFLLSLVTIYCFSLKKYYKLFGLIPIAYVIFIYIIQVIPNLDVYQYIPKAFIPEYNLYGFTLILGSYYILKFYNYSISKALNDSSLEEAYKETTQYKIKYNAFVIVPLLILTILITLLRYVAPMFYTLPIPVDLQSYALLAAIPLILYSGKLGFNNKITKYGFYAYYPVHIILIFAIFALIFM